MSHPEVLGEPCKTESTEHTVSFLFLKAQSMKGIFAATFKIVISLISNECLSLPSLNNYLKFYVSTCNIN